MSSYYEAPDYNQECYPSLISPLQSLVPMANDSILYTETIPLYPSSLSFSTSFDIETSYNPNPLLSPRTHRVKKRKSADSLLEHSSSSPLSTPSYSSTTSSSDANLPSKKSKSTLPTQMVLSKQQRITREETKFTEDEVYLKQRSLERNRLAGSVVLHFFVFMLDK